MIENRELNVRVKMSIPQKAKEELEEIAAQEHKSFSALCREVLLQYLQDHSQK